MLYFRIFKKCVFFGIMLEAVEWGNVNILIVNYMKLQSYNDVGSLVIPILEEKPHQMT